MKVKNIKGVPEIISLNGYDIPNNIFVVGCGGTGGHLIPHLARFVATQQKEITKKINLVIADGDIVEQKNLSRQNFVMGDLGKNKAAVMASRYSRAFGFEITAVTKDIEKVEDFHNFSSHYGQSLIIGCVDNNASRKIINQRFNDGHTCFWIDSGNEESVGQVVCGFTGISYSGGRNPICMPSVFEVFPEMATEDAKFNSELSCADRAQSAPQNMQTNVTAATIIMNYAQKILRGQPLMSHGVDFSIENVYSTRLNTKANLSKVSVSRRKKWEKHYE